MRVETTIAGVRALVASFRAPGRRIALVPTMGALHEGHLSLVRLARERADMVVASVFVNPLQFGAAEDLGRYPRTPAADHAALAAAHADVLFAPDAAEMYPVSGAGTRVVPGPVAERFEGSVRPGHFAGVLTVVAKLINVVQPDVMTLGQKDLQQVAVIRTMLRDLDVPVEVAVGETVRDHDGLALSSRNVYLSPAERTRAAILPGALGAAARTFALGETDPHAIERVALDELAADPELGVDYVAVVDPDNFEQPERVRAGHAVIAAVRIGATRLIDNVVLRTASP